MKVKTSERLKEIMRERNLKQVDILKMLKPICDKYSIKLNKSHLSQYCSGHSEPETDKLFALSVALNVNESWLLGYDAPRERISDVERFRQTAEVVNRNLLEQKHLAVFRKLNDENREKIIMLTQKLLEAQSAEENILIAAHRREENEE